MNEGIVTAPMGQTSGVRIASEAHVDPSAEIGSGTTVWNRAYAGPGAIIGRDCTLGQGAFIDAGVRLGSRCKIQNNALVYTPATIGDGVFIGPGAILTNDRYPRAINADSSLKAAADWEPLGVIVGNGASIGAGAVLIGGVSVGAWAMIAAGAVVTRDVVPFSLVSGVPASPVGWVGRSGQRLESGDGYLVDPANGERFKRDDDGVRPWDD
jgi:UDP-2-acetamido-3-amino-2,3-dideoxy-glucuronate N-acetyltransferase